MYLGPGTTAGKIDEYGTRFTIVNGAHFLIAGNGKEAWPISAAEAAAFKAHYRRHMVRARWIRRGLVLVPILWVLLSSFVFVDMSDAVRRSLGKVVGAVFVFGVPIGFLQHLITSDLTRIGIERRLKHRITTRTPEAITPQLTAAGWWGRRLIFAFVALELGMMALHALLGREALAQHMRILYRMGNGQEELLARVTGNLAWVLQLVLILAIVLLIVDRRARRKAGELAKVAEAKADKDSAREQLLRQLADEHRAAAPVVALGRAGGQGGSPVFGRNIRGQTGQGRI